MPARYTDAAGQAVAMGQHGTNQTNPTTSMSGGGDGASQQPQTADDSARLQIGLTYGLHRPGPHRT